MVIIAHRGNINGPNPESENTIDYIKKAIVKGYDVEVDIWCINDVLYMGHDFDKKRFYKNTLGFLLENQFKLWIHCKNIEALEYLLVFKELNIFGHDNDNYVLTSKHNVFCKPGFPVYKNTIMVMPEMVPVYVLEDFTNCYGVCTDYPKEITEKRFGRFCQVIL